MPVRTKMIFLIGLMVPAAARHQSMRLDIVGNATASVCHNPVQGAPFDVGNPCVEHLTICDGVTEIPKNAYFGCATLKTVTLPDSVTSIGPQAFMNCVSLQDVNFADRVTFIGKCAFRGCTSLEEVTISDSVTSMDCCPFEQCRNLRTVTIGDSLTQVPQEAFAYSNALETVTLGRAVTSIGPLAFAHGFTLRTVYSLADVDLSGSMATYCRAADGGHYVGCSFVQATPAPTSSTPSLAPPAASATGDPHLQNIHGERFDLMKPGKAVLIEIPRGQPFEKSWLTVQADARRFGSQCADMYFQSVNITGAWTDKVRAGGLAFTAAESRDETHQAAMDWTKFGPLKLKVVHGRTSNGIKYLNFYIKHLSEAGAAVGGLLGEDDYTEAATPEEGCKKFMSLEKKAISHSDVGHTEAIASLA